MTLSTEIIAQLINRGTFSHCDYTILILRIKESDENPPLAHALGLRAYYSSSHLTMARGNLNTGLSTVSPNLQNCSVDADET